MRGWRVGSLAGIDIEINYTWLFLLGLITLNMAYVLRSAQGGLPEWVYWVAGGLTALLFLGSVLVHELCHSLVARKQGMKVSRITLFIFGGVSQIEEEPRSPKVELVMTIVGPGSSAVLGFLFHALARAGEGSGPLPLPPIATASLGLIGSINFALAIFNVVPAFPLDGGRLLRSLLWAAWRDEYRATRVATALGAGLGTFMMVAGGLALLLGHPDSHWVNPASGLWFIFLGWLIMSAARQSAAQNEYKFTLSGLQAGQVMQWPVMAIPSGMRLSEALHTLPPTGVQPLYPVVDETGRARGVLDQRSLTHVTPAQWGEVTVERVMSPLEAALIVEAHEPVTEALMRLVHGGRGWLLVNSPEGRPVGLVTEQSILTAAQRQRRAR